MKGISIFCHSFFNQYSKTIWLNVHKSNESEVSREALLRYCELDTWAMVKVWERLEVVAK